MNATPSPPREIVLIPGFMCDASLWQAILPTLEIHGKLHLPDLNQGSSIEAMAEYLLPKLPVRGTLIGFSLGAYVTSVSPACYRSASTS